ncbi:MAG: response regulator [Chloroflexales bacterium]|nr:response regulator [Chloroflexales bacterium]
MNTSHNQSSPVFSRTLFDTFVPDAQSGNLLRAKTPDQTNNHPHPGSNHILVADDEAAVRDIVARILRACRFQVLIASSDPEGLKLLQAHSDSIVAVLLDLTMPHMSGMETLRLMEQMKPELRVILMSGYGNQDITLDPSSRTLTRFIQKPFDVLELQTALYELITS